MHRRPKTPDTHTILSTQGELLTLAEAKLHLNVDGEDHDAKILQTLREARRWCEKQCNQTLRLSVARRWKTRHFPRCRVFSFPFPPLISVTSLKYYPDASSTLTTIDATSGSTVNYRVIGEDAPTEVSITPGLLEFDEDYTLPTLDERADAVQVEYTTGYQRRDNLPADAQHACKIVLWELYHGTHEEKAFLRARDLLFGVMSTVYH